MAGKLPPTHDQHLSRVHIDQNQVSYILSCLAFDSSYLASRCSAQLAHTMPVLSLSSAGQPGDTPQDRLSYVLNQLCLELDSDTSNASSKARMLASQARDIVDGMDDYMTRMSSPHPTILDTMIEEGNKRDWGELHRSGKTQFKLMPEMTAGPYEAVVLQQLAKLGRVCDIVWIPSQNDSN